MADEYHPLAIRMWSVMTIHKDGRHEIPEAVERAALVLLRRIDEPRELVWAHSSLHSLWAETYRLGQKDAADAFSRLLEEAKKLVYTRADVWRRDEAPRPEAPDAQHTPKPALTAGPGTPLGSMLSRQPRRV